MDRHWIATCVKLNIQISQIKLGFDEPPICQVGMRLDESSGLLIHDIVPDHQNTRLLQIFQAPLVQLVESRRPA